MCAIDNKNKSTELYSVKCLKKKSDWYNQLFIQRLLRITRLAWTETNNLARSISIVHRQNNKTRSKQRPK